MVPDYDTFGKILSIHPKNPKSWQEIQNVLDLLAIVGFHYDSFLLTEINSSSFWIDKELF